MKFSPFEKKSKKETSQPQPEPKPVDETHYLNEHPLRPIIICISVGIITFFMVVIIEDKSGLYKHMENFPHVLFRFLSIWVLYSLIKVIWDVVKKKRHWIQLSVPLATLLYVLYYGFPFPN